MLSPQHAGWAPTEWASFYLPNYHRFIPSSVLESQRGPSLLTSLPVALQLTVLGSSHNGTMNSPQPPPPNLYVLLTLQEKASTTYARSRISQCAFLEEFIFLLNNLIWRTAQHDWASSSVGMLVTHFVVWSLISYIIGAAFPPHWYNDYQLWLSSNVNWFGFK